MTKFIQVCASQNDLFALDDEGNVYQYHFNVKAWVKLITNRESEERGVGLKNWSAGSRGEGYDPTTVDQGPLPPLPVVSSRASTGWDIS